MSSKITKRFFNPPQCEVMAVSAKDVYIIAARGTGKSEGMDAPRILNCVFGMPRSNGAILSPTYAKLLQNTLPATAYGLSRLGYHRDRHYFIGRKPPKSANFARPLREPFSYEHVMSWFNGTIYHLISFDRAMSTNSMSLDHILGPEAKFLPFDKIKNEVYPAMRGNREYFSDCPWHGGSFFSSDMPTSKGGMWLLDKEKDMDTELIALIKLLYIEYKEIKDKFSNKPTAYSKRSIARLERELRSLRSKATFFGEYSAIDNVEILGVDWIAKQKRELPDLLFRTAILNQRIRKVANGFYSSLDEDIHFYVPPGSGLLDTYEYDLNKTKKSNSLWDTDVLPNEPLCLANDYNAAINCLVVGQPKGRNLRTLKSFYVKTPRKLKDVTNEFCDYYNLHLCRTVVYYHDSTSIATDAKDDESFADTVMSVLRKRGWSVIPIYLGQPMRHDRKHEMINRGLRGDDRYLFPTFNLHNCEFLKIAMEQAGIKIGYKGFQKDKTAEKEPDSPDSPDEFKTHITDAWDTLYVGCCLQPFSGGSSSLVSTFIK
jgi:hypothetical protein